MRRWLAIVGLTGVTGLAWQVLPAGADATTASKLGCHSAFTFPAGRPSDDVYNAVMVLSRRRMSCSGALRIAAEAYALKGLKLERGPQFGGGGWGGPFRTGRFHCFVLNRGSDFINAKCDQGSRHIRFYDHRQYWSIPTPGWHKPALHP